MDRVNQKMKKFRGVFEGLRQSVTAPPKADTVEETLQSEHFQLAKTVRHGFPYQPTAMAWDSVQHLLAIGTKTGSVRIFGRPGVDCHIKHEGEVAVIQILFLVNEGAMITVCSDDQLHLWNLRQKKPEIVHSLKFQRERITCCHLPFQSKWLYVGSERGNVHIVNIESFVLSGYIINWNKAIDLSRKNHPGQVVHLSGNPQDPNKMLVGFELDLIVYWDLKSKCADIRFNLPDQLRSISWHQDGKQFIASHTDGSLTIWNLKTPRQPHSILMPHAKVNSDGKPEPCRPIMKVEWKCARNSDPYMIFSGGMPKDRAMRAPALTVMHGKSTTVLEMEHNVIDFITLCSTPWDNDFQDPFGIVVLLQNDLVVVDLTTPGYPCFENPYPMDIHEAPVTACRYVADCPHDIIPALYQVGFKQKKTGFSEKEWPVKGGEWGTTTCSYPEVIISGHADGSLKFWDASAATLQVLYKLKTAKLFDKSKCKNPDPDDDPFAIQHIYFCAESRLLCVAGVTHVILFKFCKQEISTECTVIETAIVYEIYDDTESPEMEYPPSKPSIGSVSQQSGSMGSYSSTCSDTLPKQETMTSVRVKSGSKKWSPGYHPELCCVLQWLDGEPPPPITSLSLNAKFGLLAFGNECGIAIVDIIQKCCLLNMGTPDLYGSMDPYSRAPRSPKNKSTSQPSSISSGYPQNAVNDENKSPTSEQSSVTRLTSGERTRKHSRPQTFILEKITEAEAEPKLQAKPPLRTHKSFDEDYLNTITAEAELLGIESGEDALSTLSKSLNVQALACHKESDSSTVHFEKMPAGKAKNTAPSPSTNSSFDFIPEVEEATESITNEADKNPPGLLSPTDTGQFDGPELDSKDKLDQSKKHKKGFFHNLIHKSDGKEPTQSHKSDRKITDSQEIRFSDLKDSASDENDLTLQSSSAAAESYKSSSDQIRSLPDTQLPAGRSNDDWASHDQTCVSAPEGLPRQSKSDYSLVRRTVSLPQGAGLYSQNNVSKSSQNLGQTCDATPLTALQESSQEQHIESCDNIVASQATNCERNPSSSADETDSHHPAQNGEKSSEDISSKIPPKRESFVRKLSRKVKAIGNKSPDPSAQSEIVLDSAGLVVSKDDKRKKSSAPRFEVIDLTDDEVGEKPPTRKMTYSMLLAQCDGSFSRSRSSSLSSLENISKEAIQCLVFADAYTRKTDTCTCPCLWVGTSLGSVLVINLQLPTEQDRRKEPVVVSPSGTIFRLTRGILCMSFLDCNGILMGAVADQWQDGGRPDPTAKENKKMTPYQRQQSQQSLNSQLSSNSSTDLPVDRQFAIICSERHARVISLPSQTCAYSHKITDTSFVSVADVISIKNTVCLACYIANGHIITFSLPSLRPMLDADCLPLTDLRIARTFQFSNNGHALYFCSPSELQKMTLSADICDSLDEMLGELFKPCDTPEAPKKTFFQNLFSGGASTLDREELFGEGCGKPSKGVAKYSPGNAGMQQTQERAGAATSEIGRAKMAAIERGQKLGQLSDTTERLRDDAEQYRQQARDIMLKYKNKKWYQF